MLPGFLLQNKYYFLLYFLTGNYHESLSDAKVAIELQPSFIKAFVRGKIYFAIKLTI